MKSKLKSGHKQREGCRKGMKHRIKDQIRTTEIVNLADMVLIRERRLDGRNAAARKDFDMYRSVVEGEEEREE